MSEPRRFGTAGIVSGTTSDDEIATKGRSASDANFSAAEVESFGHTLRRAGHVLSNEARRYVNDARGMASAPAHWDAIAWTHAAASASAIGISFTIDDELQRVAQNNRTSSTVDFSKFVTPWGGRRADYAAIAMLVAGAGFRDARLRETGRDALEASILASRIVTPIVKQTVGRSRPFENEGSLAFDPFSGNQSFPSGHATNAFAVASAVAAHYDGWKVPTFAYSLATSVAFARVHDNVHWTSDVVTGAIIGTSIGRGIVARHQPRSVVRDDAIRIQPFVLPRGAGFFVTMPLERLVHF